MGANRNVHTLMLDAMSLAELAHRTLLQGPYHVPAQLAVRYQAATNAFRSYGK